MSATDSIAEQQLHRKRFLYYQVPYVALYVAALGLIAMTHHESAGTSIFWQMFIPVVALVSLLGGWRYAGTAPGSRWAYVLKQVLHWGALVLVIQLLYARDPQDFLNDEQDGFVVMYLLGLAAILSGIYLDWRMALFGVFVLLSGVAIASIDDAAMLLTLIAGAGVAAVVATLFVRHQGTRVAAD